MRIAVMTKIECVGMSAQRVFKTEESCREGVRGEVYKDALLENMGMKDYQDLHDEIGTKCLKAEDFTIETDTAMYHINYFEV